LAAGGVVFASPVLTATLPSVDPIASAAVVSALAGFSVSVLFSLSVTIQYPLLPGDPFIQIHAIEENPPKMLRSFQIACAETAELYAKRISRGARIERGPFAIVTAGL
jgi:hypothetical protein